MECSCRSLDRFLFSYVSARDSCPFLLLLFVPYALGAPAWLFLYRHGTVCPHSIRDLSLASSSTRTFSTASTLFCCSHSDVPAHFARLQLTRPAPHTRLFFAFRCRHALHRPNSIGDRLPSQSFHSAAVDSPSHSSSFDIETGPRGGTSKISIAPLL